MNGSEVEGDKFETLSVSEYDVAAVAKTNTLKVNNLYVKNFPPGFDDANMIVLSLLV